MKINKKAIITICILAAAAAISGCGKKSAPDAASSQVIQISVAPEETTQTPAPDQIDSSAVTTNGNLTMVNEYLADRLPLLPQIQLLNRTVRQIPHRIAARITNGCTRQKAI